MEFTNTELQYMLNALSVQIQRDKEREYAARGAGYKQMALDYERDVRDGIALSHRLASAMKPGEAHA